MTAAMAAMSITIINDNVSSVAAVGCHEVTAAGAAAVVTLVAAAW